MDLTVLVGEKSAGPQQGIVVVHIIYFKVLCKRITHLDGQVIVRHISDSQHVGPGLFQMPAETVVMRREVR